MKSCAMEAISAKWISRRATLTVTPSRIFRAVRNFPSLRWRGARWSARTTRRVSVDRTDSRSTDRHIDPGYYLISQGGMEFERELGFQSPWRRGFLRLYVRAAVPGYLGNDSSAYGDRSDAALAPCAPNRARALICCCCLALLAVIPASDLAISLINRAVTDLLGPANACAAGIEGRRARVLRTMIVMPILLDVRQHGVKEQAERLEVHYLANPDGDSAVCPAFRLAPRRPGTDAGRRRAARRSHSRDCGVEQGARPSCRRRGSGSSCFIASAPGTAQENAWMGSGAEAGKTARIEPASSRFDDHEFSARLQVDRRRIAVGHRDT